MSRAQDYIDALGEELQWCNSGERLPAIIRFAGTVPRLLREDDWLRMLGREWSGFDHVTKHLPELFKTPFGRAIKAESPVREMMDEGENLAFDALPDLVTIWRGCYPLNVAGVCWSLDRATAARFPFLNRYKGAGEPILLEAKVDKRCVVALKLDREEAEVIALSPRIISTVKIGGAK